jgi:hypothetical protein
MQRLYATRSKSADWVAPNFFQKLSPKIFLVAGDKNLH